MNSNDKYHLRVLEGPDSGQIFTVDLDRQIIIGRGSQSDTKIRDPQLSRDHCGLRWTGSSFALQDHGGSGGTWVNGEQIEGEISLAIGTVIQIGQTKLRLEKANPLDEATLAGAVMPQTMPKPAPATPAPAMPGGTSQDLIGHLFQNRFRVDKQISSGGTSIVFKGTDTEHNRPVAIKVLKPQMASSDTQRERFIRAMKTVMPVKHDNIVRLRMAGKQGQYCWAATDWIEGSSIATLIDKIGIGGMLEWKQVWRAACHLTEALREAEKHGVIHRNVTPTNLMRRDEDRQYMLCDLIYAKALEATDASNLTRPGDVIGELGYMAPERLLNPDAVDSRSDQYGLGATLYAMLLGAPPFPVDNLAKLLEAFRGSPPPSPAQQQMGIDERFSDLVMKMIHIRPEHRYENMSAVAKDLERVGKLGGLAT